MNDGEILAMVSKSEEFEQVKVSNSVYLSKPFSKLIDVLHYIYIYVQCTAYKLFVWVCTPL